ncbi:MAG: hypothetical protein IRZ03_14705 [Acidobacterium ailaaui]|jgi:hypothetical protein|nr:hypothetical protein [Pseudacidobacterium ailaaui]
MTAIAGYGGTVKLGASGGSTAVGQVKDWTLTLSADIMDTTTMGNGPWKTYMAGLLGGEGKLTCNFDPTDTGGQLALQQALLTGGTVTVNLYVTTSPNHYYSATALVKQMEIKLATDSIVEASLDVTLSGPVTYS